MQPARLATALLLGVVAAAPAWADDVAVAAPAVADGAEPALPTAVPAPPRWTAGGAFETGGYRMSVSRGAFDVGLRFEQRAIALRPTETHAEPATFTLPTLSFELRSISAAPATGSSLAERALGSAAAATAPASKVGVEWKPAQSQVFFHGGVGVRLNGDDSVVMRLRKGTLGFYMQRAF